MDLSDIQTISFFFFHLTYSRIHQNIKISWYRRVRPNRKRISQTLLPWNKWLNWADIYSRTWGDLIAMVWKDKHDVCIMINMHNPWTHCNFSMSMGMIQSQESYKITTNIRGTQTKGTTWLTETTFSLVRLNNFEQLPPPGFIWC